MFNFSEEIFCTDGNGDDFTVYLPVPVEKPGDSNKDPGTLLGTISPVYSGTIKFKNLTLTRNSLVVRIDGANVFWKQLAAKNSAKKATKKSEALKLLRKKLIERLQGKVETKGVLKKLKSAGQSTLTSDDRKLLIDLILVILNNYVRGSSDFDSLTAARAIEIPNLNAKQKDRWTRRLKLDEFFEGLLKKYETGRALVCSSYRGRTLSVTVRKQKDATGYKALPKTNRGKNLFSLGEYCDCIYTQVFEKTKSTTRAHGLLVIAGATNSAKSEIARGLIHRYLNQPKSSGSRHSHLVTFEDPIERQYLRFATDKKTGAFAVAIAGNQDYTPREKYSDVPSLRSALTDALRQTPKVFFVGETRNKRDWELLLEFAGTGHLIVTTSHASSLVEAMHRIFEARKAVTAADRNEVASRLLGVVHLRSDELEDGPKILYPSLWRRTPRGIAALTSDGLAALLPHRTREGVDSAISCLGSCFIVEQLVLGIKDSNLKQVFVDAQMKALQVDLIGA